MPFLGKVMGFQYALYKIDFVARNINNDCHGETHFLAKIQDYLLPLSDSIFTLLRNTLCNTLRFALLVAHIRFYIEVEHFVY